MYVKCDCTLLNVLLCALTGQRVTVFLQKQASSLECIIENNFRLAPVLIVFFLTCLLVASLIQAQLLALAEQYLFDQGT